jgi:hypothetical protein
MTTLDRPTTRTGSSNGSSGAPFGPNGAKAPEAELNGAGEGQDPDTVNSYGLDGFKPARSDPSGASDPQDAIDLEALAEQVYLLLLREAYIERERLGARR